MTYFSNNKINKINKTFLRIRNKKKHIADQLNSKNHKNSIKRKKDDINLIDKRIIIVNGSWRYLNLGLFCCLMERIDF